MKCTTFFRFTNIVFFVIIYILVGFKIFNQTTEQHAFILGDWLINYRDGGFRRRGLSGEIFFLLQDISSLPLEILVSTIQLVFLFIFLTFCLLITLKKIKEEPYYFTLFFLPTTLFFWINDFHAVGRKEILFLMLFSIYIFLNSNKCKYHNLFFGFFLGIFTLMHEITIFYLPYFFVCMHHRIKNYLPLIFIFQISIFSAITFLLIYFFGDINFSNGQVMEILKERGINEMSNALIDFKDSSRISLENLKKFKLLNSISYSVPIIFTASMLYFYEKTHKETITVFKIYLTCILLSAPLFILAIDWGRWIFIHSIMSILLLSVKKTDRSKKNTFVSKIIFLFLFLLGFLFKMYHVEKGVLKSFLSEKLLNLTTTTL